MMKNYATKGDWILASNPFKPMKTTTEKKKNKTIVTKKKKVINAMAVLGFKSEKKKERQGDRAMRDLGLEPKKKKKAKKSTKNSKKKASGLKVKLRTGFKLRSHNLRSKTRAKMAQQARNAALRAMFG